MEKLLNWCKRYISLTSIAVLGVFIYMLFFQENSSARIYGYERTIDSLRQEIKVQEDTMLYYRSLNRGLDTGDRAVIERAVRENFNMALPDEDIYIFQNVKHND